MLSLLEPGFWNFNLGHVVILLGMLGGFVVWFSKFESRMGATSRGLEVLTREMEKTFAEQRDSMAALSRRVREMDEQGTRKSQQLITADESVNRINTARIDELEKINREWIPKVAAMARDVHWLVSWIETNGIPRKSRRQSQNGD